MSERKREDGQIAECIRGAPKRIGTSTAALVCMLNCSRKGSGAHGIWVARLMKGMGLSAGRVRHRTITTRQDPPKVASANHLAQDFTASRPNEKWLADITAMWTAQGWLYVAGLLDLFSRGVVGWAMAATQNETRVPQALHMALARRCPREDLLLHSDRGCQYTSSGYQALLAQVGIVGSMSRTGNCYDRAAMESFFGTLKRECVERCSFSTRVQARQTVFEFIECFYKRVRRHSSLGYVSPIVYEQLMC